MTPEILAQIHGNTPAERLRALCDVVPGRKVFTTSFGIEDQALAHIIFTEKLPIDVVTLDTGRMFPETYKVWAETELKYGKRIRAYYPDARAVGAFVADAGINGFYYSKDSRKACCDVRKVEPLDRALEEAAAWVTGLRADQSGQRGATPLAAVERDLIKVSPLHDWTRDMVVDFVAANAVPINELHGKGYPSIGCEPCTRAIEPHENERAGRWWWESDDTKECGLHVDDSGRLVRAKAA